MVVVFVPLGLIPSPETISSKPEPLSICRFFTIDYQIVLITVCRCVRYHLLGGVHLGNVYFMIMACCSAEAYDAVSCFVCILRQGCYRKAVSYPFYGKYPVPSVSSYSQSYWISS